MAVSTKCILLVVLCASPTTSPPGRNRRHGPGLLAPQATFDGSGVLEPFDTERWDLLLRVGLDAYVTKNWLVNVELAPSVRFAEYGDILGTATDNVSLTFTGGVQYSF